MAIVIGVCERCGNQLLDGPNGAFCGCEHEHIAKLETELAGVKATLALHRDLKPFSENDMAIMRSKRDVAHDRIAELEAQISHIIRWCEQDNSALTKRQVLDAVVRMCNDDVP